MNIWNFIRNLLPANTLNVAINLVKHASIKFMDNAARREWVVKELINTLHIKESIARIAVEIALQTLKGKEGA